MLDVRSPLILAAAPLGLLLACAGWLLLGGSSGSLRPLDAIEARASAAPRAKQGTGPEISSVSTSAPAPLFVLAPTAVVRLDGISRTARRTAALLSFNGATSRWVTAGVTQEGVTLVEIGSTRVVVETLDGRQTIALGETSAPPVNSAALPLAVDDGAPPSLRQGIPPASAPGTP